MNIFMGHFDIVLEELILQGITIDEVIVENKSSNHKVIQFCQQRKIPFHIINSYEDLVKNFSKFEKKVDYCFVASFGKILKMDIIDKCNFIINFHPGDVFTCRGRHPLPSAILHNYAEMGITVHLIKDENIDAGPILYRLLMPIDYNSSYKNNENRLMRALRHITSLVAEDIKNGKIITLNWDVKKSIYFKPLENEILSEIIKANSLKDIQT